MKQLLVLAITASLVTNCNKPGAPPPGETPGSGKLLSDWIHLQLRLVRNTTGVTHVAYSRHFSYTGIAFYEALVPGEPAHRSLAGQLNGLDHLPAPPAGGNTCWYAAANAAYAAMMRNFYSGNPINLPLIDSMENAWKTLFSTAGFTAGSINTGAGFGKQVADALLSWAAGDAADKSGLAYTPPAGEGLWVPTPPAYAKAAAPYWSNNRTIVPHSTDQAMPAPPLSFSTDPKSPFYQMVKELYDTSLRLGTEEKAIASFWDDSPNGKYVTAFGHWASILAQLIDTRHLKLTKAAEAYVAMAVAMNDACIVCWKGKYTFSQLRPVTYIRRYFNDSSWLPYIVTPPHPEYPAAHSSLSYAAAEALTAVLGSNISFTDHTYDDLGVSPHSFPDILSAAKEAGISRLYGGIHYRPSIEAGYECGKITAMAVMAGLRFGKQSGQE